ncbi:MAG: phosphoenolpyruvate--protein phosphotransferase [Candidatus Omnitrophota bacterium]
MSKTIQLKGIPAAPGIAIGMVYLFGKPDLLLEKIPIDESKIPLEIARFEEALIKTRREIMDIQKKISKDMGSAGSEIFDAHLLVLEDRMLIDEVISRLKKEKLCVEYIFGQALSKYIKVFSKIKDEYLRERVSDINDVARRVIHNLMGKRQKALIDLEEPVIVVAHDLSPSDTAVMQKQHVIAIVTDIGGRTSHTAIMAKSLQIPAVVGLENATRLLKSGDRIIVDGEAGIIIINPSKEQINKYTQEQQNIIKLETLVKEYKDLPAVTLDGKKIALAANIELPEEVDSVIAHGAEGIGLYRTEFFYMNRKDLPTENEHYERYRVVAEKVAPDSVVVRTLDLGGDKFLSALKLPNDMVPFLGWRAIRFCLAQPEIFKVQLRAILRASAHGNLKLMYPMISGIEELRQANKLLDECKRELKKEKKAFDENIEVGAMIEVPSAALTCDILAREVNFFSIGTNDLIQYSLAVDRSNEKVAYLYEPAHPAVLRLIKTIIDTAHRANIWVGMCGEMAGEPTFAITLLGMGLDEFSVSTIALSAVKRIIRSVSFKEAKEIANTVLTLSNAKDVQDFTNSKLREILDRKT